MRKPEDNGFPTPLGFTTHNILPPFLGLPEKPKNLSPFLLSPEEVVSLLGPTAERISILRQFFQYREGLREEGFSGFQWIHGTFTENHEKAEGKPPFGIEFMNFVAFDDINDLNTEHFQLLYESSHINALYPQVYPETYQIVVESSDAYIHQRTVTHHFSFKSHQISKDPCLSKWKGLISIRLSSNEHEDDSAIELLSLGVKS